MALPSTHRWIALGNLDVRNKKGSSLKAPKTSVSEILQVAADRLADDRQYREYGVKKSRLMWFSDFVDFGEYHVFLAQNGDKNAAGVSYIDFDTRQSRDVPKDDSEGALYTGHIAISKKPFKGSGHLVLVERVPGIYLGSLREHLSWLCGDDTLQKPFVDETGSNKIARAVIEIDGHQSSTIRDALKGGSLQDIEFIRTSTDDEDGLDEDDVVKEIIHKATWEVKQKVNEQAADSVFAKMRRFFNEDFRKDSEDAHMFVRIKTAAGQIKRTEVDDDEGSVLEQAFVHNELINDFKEPLAQRHEGIRRDVVEKMLEIPGDLKIDGGKDVAT